MNILKYTGALFAGVLLCANVAAAQTTYEISSKDNITIGSNGAIVGMGSAVTLAKGSEITVSYVPTRSLDLAGEPKATVRVLDASGATVFSITPPARSISGKDPAEIDAFIAENKNYVSHVRIADGRMLVTVPAGSLAGNYQLTASFAEAEGEVHENSLAFVVSAGSYVLENVQAVFEGKDLYIKAPYRSFSPTDNEEDLAILVLSGDTVIDEYRAKETFYEAGEIVHTSTVETEGDIEVRIIVTDAAGNQVLVHSQMIERTEAPRDMNVWWWVSSIVLFVMIVVVAIVMRRKKALPVVMLAFAFFGIQWADAQAPSQCVDKPGAFCQEDQKMDYLCQLSNGDCTNTSFQKLYFNTGSKQNVASDVKVIGPASASMNVCNALTTMAAGQKFYMLTDVGVSSWAPKRFFLYEFAKGTSKTVTYNSVGNKQNIQYATYDGNCTVTSYSKYVGASSDHRLAQTTIREVGLVNSTMCRSRVVNSSAFKEQGSLLGLSTCASDQLQDKFIAGSRYITNVTPPPGAWSYNTADICAPLGLNDSTAIAQAKASGKQFYFLINQSGSWIYYNYPIFQFAMGTAKNSQYLFPSSKTNITRANYDGDCTVTFFLQYSGDATDSWDAHFSFWETGFVNEAMCYDPIMEQTVGSFYDWQYVRDQRIATNAPFFLNLRKCFDESSCALNKTWIPYPTGETCINCNGTYVPAADMCTSGAFGVSCTATPSYVSGGANSVLKATPYNATSTVSYSWVSQEGISLTGSGSQVTASGGSMAFVSLFGVDVFHFTVTASSGGKSASSTCRVTVGHQCDNTYNEGQLVCNQATQRYSTASCTATGWKLTATTMACSNNAPGAIQSFKIDPYIMSTAGTCKAQVSVTGMDSCSIRTLSGTTIATGLSGEYNINQTGTFKLVCTDFTGTTTESGAQRCISNPGVQEN